MSIEYKYTDVDLVIAFIEGVFFMLGLFLLVQMIK
jgi:hypothetical protein